MIRLVSMEKPANLPHSGIKFHCFQCFWLLSRFQFKFNKCILLQKLEIPELQFNYFPILAIGPVYRFFADIYAITNVYSSSYNKLGKQGTGRKCKLSEFRLLWCKWYKSTFWLHSLKQAGSSGMKRQRMEIGFIANLSHRLFRFSLKLY